MKTCVSVYYTNASRSVLTYILAVLVYNYMYSKCIHINVVQALCQFFDVTCLTVYIHSCAGTELLDEVEKERFRGKERCNCKQDEKRAKPGQVCNLIASIQFCCISYSDTVDNYSMNCVVD